MIGEVLDIGDKVVVNIPDENWNWGYNPVGQQKGKVGTVTGFAEIDHPRVGRYGREPGIYVNYHWMQLDILGDEHISSFCLQMEDQDEYKRRVSERTAQRVTKLRDLPEMKFWEDDIVEVSDSPRYLAIGRNGEIMIRSINYGYLGRICTDGETPMPEYNVCPVGRSGGYTPVNEGRLTLVRRGNVWKHFNGEKPEFKDIEEEIEFFIRLGHYEEVRNPVSENYNWQYVGREGEEEALLKGLIDQKRSRTNTIRFTDRELGERVRMMAMRRRGMPLPEGGPHE